MGARPGTQRPLTTSERARLENLVRDCGPRLLAYVRRAYGTRVDAEEIVAESFCRAAANMRTLDGCERPDIYVLTIARNLCRDQFRRPGTRCPSPASGSERPLDERPAAVALPAETLARNERRRALMSAVEGLPEAEREVVVLRLSGTLKFTEIAGMLGVPLGTVLSRMHTALQRLKQSLGATHES